MVETQSRLMKAVRIHEHGGAEVIRWEEIPVPQLPPAHVLVKVRASGINHLDLWVRSGIPGIDLPRILGSDFSGEVVETGDAVSRWSKGDEIIGIPGRSCGMCDACLEGRENLCPEFRIYGEDMDGIQSEFAILPQNQLLRKPSSMNHMEAAAYPLVFQTAWTMLQDRADIKPLDTILVLGGAGGIGSAAIQIARYFHGRIIATAGSDQKMEFCRRLGADEVIHHHRESIADRVKEITAGEGVDVVIEHPGKATWDESIRSLKKGGTLVTCGATTGYLVNLDLRFLFSKQYNILGSTMGSKSALQAVTDLMEEGEFSPVINQMFPAEDVVEAHRYMESGGHIGKVVLTF